MVPLVLAGQGTIQARPPKLSSPTDSKSLNGSIVGQQSGEGLDEVLGATARFSTRGGVFLNRKSSAMLAVTQFHSNKRHGGCLHYLLQAPLNLLHHRLRARRSVLITTALIL